jgi:hypothetical protein
LSKIKNKPFQNQAQMSDFTKSLEKINEERLEKLRHANSSSVYLSYPSNCSTVSLTLVVSDLSSPAKATARDVKSYTEVMPHYSCQEDADEDDIY